MFYTCLLECLPNFSISEQQVKMEEVTWEEIHRGTRLLADDAKAAELVKNPVLRSIVELWQGVTAICASQGQPAEPLEALLRQVASQRAAAPQWRGSEEVSQPEVFDDRLVVSLYKKTSRFLPARTAWELLPSLRDLKHKHDAHMEAQKAKDAERAAAAAKNTENALAESPGPLGVASSSAGCAAAATNPAAVTASDTERAVAPASAPRFAVGQIVRLSVTRSKDLYDQRQAFVLAVLTRDLRVKLLEGPKKGEEKKFAHDKCAIVETPDKKEDAVSDSHGEHAAKRQKLDDEEMWMKAEDLFGNLDNI